VPEKGRVSGGVQWSSLNLDVMSVIGSRAKHDWTACLGLMGVPLAAITRSAGRSADADPPENFLMSHCWRYLVMQRRQLFVLGVAVVLDWQPYRPGKVSSITFR